MTLVTDVLRDAAGLPVAGVPVTVELVSGSGPALIPDRQGSVVTSAEVSTDGEGRWTVDLVPNGRILPAGTHYTISARPPGSSVLAARIVVPEPPVDGSAVWVGTLLVEPIPARQPPLPVGYLAGGQFVTGQLYVQDDPPPPEVRQPGTVWVNTAQAL